MGEDLALPIICCSERISVETMHKAGNGSEDTSLAAAKSAGREELGRRGRKHTTVGRCREDIFHALFSKVANSLTVLCAKIMIPVGYLMRRRLGCKESAVVPTALSQNFE